MASKFKTLSPERAAEIARLDSLPIDQMTPEEARRRYNRLHKRAARERVRQEKFKADQVEAERKFAWETMLEDELRVTKLGMELATYLAPNLDGTPTVLDEEDLAILRDEVIPDVEEIIERGVIANYDYRREPIQLWRKFGCLPLTLVKDFQCFVEVTLGKGLMPATERTLQGIDDCLAAAKAAREPKPAMTEQEREAIRASYDLAIRTARWKHSEEPVKE